MVCTTRCVDVTGFRADCLCVYFVRSGAARKNLAAAGTRRPKAARRRPNHCTISTFLYARSFVPPSVSLHSRRALFRFLPLSVTVAVLKTGVVSGASGSSYLEVQNTKVICAVYFHEPTHPASLASVSLSSARTVCSRCSYGPRQTSKTEFLEEGRLNCEFKYATYACDRRRKHQPVLTHSLFFFCWLVCSFRFLTQWALGCERLQEKDEQEASLIMEQALAVSVRLVRYPKAAIDVYALVLQDDGGTSRRFC
jgi:hypothetical protein